MICRGFFSFKNLFTFLNNKINNKIVCFSLSLGFNPESNSFHTSAENLKNFQSIPNSLPNGLLQRCNQYKTNEELSSKFMKKKAVFHKSCIARYNKQKLNRKRKHEESNEDVVIVNQMHCLLRIH